MAWFETIRLVLFLGQNTERIFILTQLSKGPFKPAFYTENLFLS